MKYPWILAILLISILIPLSLDASAPGEFPRLSGTDTMQERRLHLGNNSILPYVLQWTYVFTINRELGSDIRGSDFKTWLKNVTSLPEIPDGDDWTINYVGHPLLGATFYSFYRNRGFSAKRSFWGAVLQSTLFEYTVEAWKQPASGVDLIVTPVVGSLMGEKLGLNKTLILGSAFSLGKYIFRLF